MSPLPPALPPLRSKNRKGDLAEAAFVSRALRMGFNLSKPVNTNCRYDFLVEAAGRYSRIQVKSIWWNVKKGPYYVATRSGRGLRQPYGTGEVDFFAAYIVQEDAWYIIPVEEVGDRSKIHVFPQSRGAVGKFERFREAWHLLLPRGVKIGDLKAQADPACAALEGWLAPSNIDPSVRAPSPAERDRSRSLGMTDRGGDPAGLAPGVTMSQPRSGGRR